MSSQGPTFPITWYHHIWRYVYSVLLFLLLPLMLFLMRKKLRMGDQKASLENRHFSERFALYHQGILPTDFLFHCVSVGELNAAKGIIDGMMQRYPTKTFTVTTTSIAGAVHAKGLFKDKVQHLFLPIDLPFIVSRFIKKLAPTMVCITEVEIWPNLVNLCWQRKITLCLLNARLSEQSVGMYRKFSGLYRPTLLKFDVICAQNDISYKNFLSLGLTKHQVKLSKNTKFDIQDNPLDKDKGESLKQRMRLEDKRILVAASTHQPEETIVLNAFKKLKQDFEDLVLIVVPRHAHRFDDVYSLCKASGFTCARFSEQSSEVSPDILLIDAMGWLKACYSIANIAFIGGSFAPKGGHNALECALYAKPMVMGPSIFNNPEICSQLETCGALIITQDDKALDKLFNTWLANPDKAYKDGLAGEQMLNANAGAVKTTLDYLQRIISD
ncbi:3-deoxy-D-manno-octulosonic acid transferase [Glaciecola sp. 1036]|uniref:3-deoxy-D-manno-octulosonic acid transferase n=1 Tax=Alteromonadaceae TaxID=72275 RepID=UPI003CFC29EE